MFIKTTITYIALLSFLLYGGADSCFLYYKVHVNFVNHLPSFFPQPLSVNCSSKDDNLGHHTLSTFNQKWGFAFCVIPFTTLFKCDLHWNGLSMYIIAYDALWIVNPCKKGDCTWTVSIQGAASPRGLFLPWQGSLIHK
ncbi:hypothetical protein CASFOL_006415 [Castilleja foliolosa]|uniref:S-protein homolog n=1 Tax=Castilleja foliolosa TaxID=1961234 RepID=A0ABD3E774_9LAMI